MGLFAKLKEGLSKTRQNIVAGFNGIFSTSGAIDDDFYENLEEIMIMGDMGVYATEEILDELKKKVKENHVKNPAECKELLKESIREKMSLGPNAYDFEKDKSVILVIGVNGVGKTTSVGKLAADLKGQKNKVLLAAADTFRAGAIDQLKIWAERVDVPIIAQGEGADPSAVVYDSLKAFKAREMDVLIVDTAGRLHNKKNLMNELSKMNRVIDRELPGIYRENLIVLDATTGQNAIAQLKEFKEVADITGIILTKMDGTAKGGIVVAIQSEFGIPVKYIGVGEGISDLQKFDSDTFVDALFDAGEDEEKEALDSYEDEDNKKEPDINDEEEISFPASDEAADTGEKEEDLSETVEGNISSDEAESLGHEDSNEAAGAAEDIGTGLDEAVSEEGSAEVFTETAGDEMLADNDSESSCNEADITPADEEIERDKSGVSEAGEENNAEEMTDTKDSSEASDVDITDTAEEEPKRKKGFFSWFKRKKKEEDN